jgi:hypothetical protein
MKKYEVLLEIARLSILNEFDDSVTIDKDGLKKEFPFLNEQGACFVTLNLDGSLRGCIGSLVAHQSLIDDIISNARSAAFSDLRFPRLTYSEFKNISIEISILTPSIKLDYSSLEDLKSKIIPNKHGVILECQNKRATFLPQVWEQLPNFDDFFTHLSLKAGFLGSCLSLNPSIYTYTVIKVK